jgi:hypothetical protein
MKYVVLTFTALLYVLACGAIAYGLAQFGRAAVHVYAYEPVIAEAIYLPGDPYGDNFDGSYCWYRYGYQVAGKSYRGPAGCVGPEANGEIRVLYNLRNPAESILDDISTLIASGIRWVAFGGVLGFWASTWRARSVVLNGRAPSAAQWGSGAWGVLALFGFTAAAARDIADTREGFCGTRRSIVTNSLVRFVHEHERRFPREWIAAFRENVDPDGVLSGSPQCLAAMRIDDLFDACAGGFHITADIDIGSPVCDLSGKSHYKVDIEFLTDRKRQTVNVRFPEAP